MNQDPSELISTSFGWSSSASLHHRQVARSEMRTGGLVMATTSMGFRRALPLGGATGAFLDGLDDVEKEGVDDEILHPNLTRGEGQDKQ